MKVINTSHLPPRAIFVHSIVHQKSFFLDKAKWKTLSLKYPNYVINVYTQIVCSILCLNGIAPSFRNRYKSEIEIIISHGFYHSALLWQNHEFDNTV